MAGAGREGESGNGGETVKIECEQRGTRLIVRVRGELDLGTAATFRDEVNRWLDRTRARDLLLNLQGVTFIDSVGLGAILGRLRQLQRLGGTLAIVEPSGPAATVLHVGGLDKVAALHGTETGAVAVWEASAHGA